MTCSAAATAPAAAIVACSHAVAVAVASSSTAYSKKIKKAYRRQQATLLWILNREKRERSDTMMQ